MTAPLPLAMPSLNSLAALAGLIGDPARAQMLLALMGGQALTAGELARQACITAQTASGHLAKLHEAGLLSLAQQGRHRYFRLASPAVAETLENMMDLSVRPPRRYTIPGPRDAEMRLARRCYDHLAGRLGTVLAERLQDRGDWTMEEGTPRLTEKGRAFACEFGLALDGTSSRPLCKTCLDWSERRPHLSGGYGAALLDRLIGLHWLEPGNAPRALRLTRKGEDGFARSFGLASPTPDER